MVTSRKKVPAYYLQLPVLHPSEMQFALQWLLAEVVQVYEPVHAADVLPTTHDVISLYCTVQIALNP